MSTIEFHTLANGKVIEVELYQWTDGRWSAGDANDLRRCGWGWTKQLALSALRAQHTDSEYEARRRDAEFARLVNGARS